MTEKQDFVVYYSGILLNSKQPLKNCDACVVGTKNYIFLLPKQTMGVFGILITFKTHHLFEGVTIEDGLKKLIASSDSVEKLESALITLLENDPKYVHKISDLNSFKFKGFLGKHTLRMSTGGMNWTSIMPKGKGMSKEFRTFYGQ